MGHALKMMLSKVAEQTKAERGKIKVAVVEPTEAEVEESEAEPTEAGVE